MASKSQLAIQLSKLKVFDKPDLKLEQYPTDSEIAAELIHFADMQDDIEDRVVADLGCGTGILGIGALLRGALEVFFVDIDEKALELCKENLDSLELTFDANFQNIDVVKFHKDVDVVIQNPPFGVRQEHADRKFLRKACEIGDVVYSIHKIESKEFVETFAKDNGFKVTHMMKFDFPIKNTQEFHKKKIHRFEVGLWRLERT